MGMNRLGAFGWRLAWATALAVGCRATAPGRAPVSVAAAAADPMDLPVPLDPAVHTGKLPNGLTYYVFKHGAPRQRAALWLAVDAGSVEEADDQRGLAHFVEHMAFDGSRRFPKHAIVNFLERAGMLYGPDVNAVTNFDETVYQLTVPTDERSTLSEGIEVLRDIAGDVTFDPGEVENERRIVLEEWRTGQTASARLDKQWVTAFLRGSRYGERLPIGLPESIASATPAALRRFYQSWYRPEAMAVIAVGDFDARQVEAEIRARFGDFRNTTPAPQRPSLRVPREGPLAITYAIDPEARSTTVAVAQRAEHPAQISKRTYRAYLVDTLAGMMERERLEELSDRGESPFIESEVGLLRLTRGSEAHIHRVTVKEGRLSEAVSWLYWEIAQAATNGFLPSELERARNQFLDEATLEFLERDRSTPGARADEIVRNFIEHEQMPGPEVELARIRELVPTIGLAEINALVRSRAHAPGQVIAISGPPTLDRPADDKLRALVARAFGRSFPVWREDVPSEPLVDPRPVPGKVVDTAVDQGAGALVWTLDNGVRVVFKATGLRRDTVSLVGWRGGGTSLVSDADFPSARFADEIVEVGGAGSYSLLDLYKLRAGRKFSVSIGLDELGASVTGDARPDNLEAMLRLLYLRLTEPRHDHGAFLTWKTQRLETLRQGANSSDQRFENEVAALENGNHPRRLAVTASAIEATDDERAYELWKQAFGDCGGFTFVIVGNVSPARLQPLVETYLGSLPGTPSTPRWKDIGVRYPVGKVEKTVVAGEAPRSRVLLSFGAPAAFSLDADRDARVLEGLLQIRLREVLREGLGGVYAVSVAAKLAREPVLRRTLQISFQCAPEKVEQLRSAVFAALEALAREGADAGILAKISAQLRRQHQSDLLSTDWWLERLREAYRFHDDFARANDLESLLARVTSANVQASVQRILEHHAFVLAVLRPGQPGVAASSGPETAVRPASVEEPKPRAAVDPDPPEDAGSSSSKRLSMQFVDAETTHLAGDEGAINHRREARVDIRLLPNGTIMGADTGLSFKHNLFPNFSTDDQETWSDGWGGHWRQTGGVLSFDLVPGQHTCTRYKKMSAAPTETLLCDSVSRKVSFVCSSEQVAVEQTSGTRKYPTAKTVRTSAWVCRPMTEGQLADLPSPWVFGKTACLEVSGAREPRSYRDCPPDER
jgi:zinc protease